MTFTILACLAHCYAIDTDLSKTDCLAAIQPGVITSFEISRGKFISAAGYEFFCTPETKDNLNTVLKAR